MPLFPMFVDLKGRKCTCIGGGRVAERKIEALLDFEADITVISPDVSERVELLDRSGLIKVIKRKYIEGDIDGSFLVLAATPEREVNNRIYRAAAAANIFVNVADSPEECTFIFPSLVKRDEMVIGISTSGSSPALSRKVRENLEKLFPEAFGRVLKVLAEYRKRAAKELVNNDIRRRAISEMTDAAFESGQDISEEQLIIKISDIYEVYRNEKDHQGRQP